MLRRENEQLREENRLLKFQLEEYRKKFFKKKKRSEDSDRERKPPRKRGAPVGHPGVTRGKPTRIDEQMDVKLQKCPECGSEDLKPTGEVEDHDQEDIVLPQVKVTRYRHHFYQCQCCKEIVHGIGPGELPGSYMGPIAKSVAAYLHYQMKVPYRKVQRLFEQLFHLKFNPSSCVGFDQQVRVRGDPIYEKMKTQLKKEPLVHADETGWRNDGVNHWLWCFASKKKGVYHIDRSRGAKGVSSLLGDRYGGVLVSDFLGTYNKLESRKQRCLVHLLRQIKKWQIYFSQDKKKSSYFLKFKKLVQDIIKLTARPFKNKWIDAKADAKARLYRMLNATIDHPKADKFLKKLLKQIDELTPCLETPRIPAHNNFVERLLRDSVIMRKITFGNRSEKGIQNHQVLMSLLQTAQLKKLNPLTFLHTLLTRPSSAAHALL